MSAVKNEDIDALIEVVSSTGFEKAYIRETKIAVTDILGMLEDEMDYEAICNYFPALSEKHIKACERYQAQKVRS